MDIAETAKKVDALKAELAAKSSRIIDLEARVSLLETENAHLRRAMPDGEAMDHACGRLEEGLGGNKQKSVDMLREHVGDDVIELSDSEEEDNKGQSAEEGVPDVPTPVKFAVRVASGQSDNEVEIIDAEGGGGGDHGRVRSDANVCLEDDDLSIMPRGKKRAPARVISDSEDEDEIDGGHGNEEVFATSSRKRVLRRMSDGESEGGGMSDGESEGGGQGVRAVSQEHASLMVKTGMESEEDDGELYVMEGCSTPAARRSARLVKSQSKRIRPARRVLEFVESKDHEQSEDDSEEDDSMDEFIDDADCTESSADSAEESPAEPEESDDDANYKYVMSRIRGKTNAKDKGWESEPEMLSAFDEHPELILKAVCALYRKQTEEEQAEKATIVHNKKGFSQIDARRGSHIAQFLLDGDAFGPLKKNAQDLKTYDRYGLDFCHKMAFRYSKQLFKIYRKKQDPYFP